MRQWRVIYDSPTIGARNMAVDEAIMSAVAAGDAPPTLRFYDWSPACLSLGYAQKMTDVDVERLRAYGWDIVRRPTGGRAILHLDELTYSVALPAEHPVAGNGIIESYRQLSSALLAGLGFLGAQLQANRREDRSAINVPVCFEVPSHYEVTAAGRKLVGSAQVRRKNGVLQHGSLPLRGDIARICDTLVYPDDDAREAAKALVRTRATTLEEALGGRVVTWRDAADAIARGFAETFDLELIAEPLSAAELAHADELAATVYSSIERLQR